MSHDEIMSDLQQPQPENRKLEKAIRRVRVLYVEAMHRAEIHKPLAWALYQVWREVDKDEESR